jgi:hypothetical protein
VSSNAPRGDFIRPIQNDNDVLRLW